MPIISNDIVVLDAVVVGLYEVNCYFVFIKKSRNLYIIDSGSDADQIIEKAKTFDYDKVFLIQTHTHADHISALGEVKATLQPEALYMHANEYELYKSKKNEFPGVPLAENLPKPSFEIPSEEFTVLETPGHTKGGVCYYFKQFGGVFTGDTLFCGSVGRTDLVGEGDFPTLEASIRNILYALPEDVVVYPGHGPESSIGNEKKYNQCVNG